MKVEIGPYPDWNEERKVEVHIDDYDVWNMDSTLALIVTPMLRMLKDSKMGKPFVDDEDVPEHLRRAAAPPTESPWDVDDLHDARWEYVLGEMLFAFESEGVDWQQQFWTRYPKIDWTVYPEDEEEQFLPLRWEDLGECDMEGMSAMGDRIQNGFKLFGKYYQSLWT